MKADASSNIERNRWILTRFEQWTALHPDGLFVDFAREIATDPRATGGRGLLRHELTVTALRSIVRRQRQRQ
jgi:hypothetical protein